MSGPLDSPCPVCSAKAGEPCRNTLRDGQLLPGRSVHLARSEPSVWVKR